MFVTDYNDLTKGAKPDEKRTYAVNVQIAGAEVCGNKSFQHTFLGGGTEEHPDRIWMTYLWRVFRANSKTAKLAISDWAGEKEPGGPIGQELIYNFIEIQPYLED